MARLFKGVRVGSALHRRDLRLTGIVPRSPGAAASDAAVMAHVALGATGSCFVSLTRSYGVARDYALHASRARPSASRPAYVYEIDVPDPPPPTMPLLDPVARVAASLGSPASAASYHHDGVQSFLSGVVDPKGLPPSGHAAACPPGSRSAPRPAKLTPELETIVRALRDAEVLVLGNVPASSVVYRHLVF